MGVDLATFDIATAADKPQEMKLLHPVTSKELGLTLQVVGGDSETYRRNIREIRDEALANPKAEPTDPDKSDGLAFARVAVAAIIGWSEGFDFGDEKDIAFSRERAIKLLVDRAWIAEQVNDFKARRGNFFKA